MSVLTAADLTLRERELLREFVAMGGWMTAVYCRATYPREIERFETDRLISYARTDSVRRYVLTDAGKALAEEVASR